MKININKTEIHYDFKMCIPIYFTKHQFGVEIDLTYMNIYNDGIYEGLGADAIP